ncbi:MAG: hypothetical protein QW680_12525 [Pyrobaculum sp.]
MKPEEKFEVLKTLLERGAEVRTLYRDRRVVSIEKASERYVLIRYEDGGVDKLYIADFGRRRFVVVL